jgi:hypothetical protein
MGVMEAAGRCRWEWDDERACHQTLYSAVDLGLAGCTEMSEVGALDGHQLRFLFPQPLKPEFVA